MRETSFWYQREVLIVPIAVLDHMKLVHALMNNVRIFALTSYNSHVQIKSAQKKAIQL